MSHSPDIIERYNEAHIIAEWHDPRDVVLAKRISELLTQHYPGYLWAINADSRTGLVNILNMNISGQYGTRIKMNEYQTEKQLAALVIMRCGEILERYGMPRSKFHDDRYNNLALDFTGMPEGEVSH